jgi:hypothetical protein
MLALTSPTSGCRSVSIVHSRTHATEFSFCLFWTLSVCSGGENNNNNAWTELNETWYVCHVPENIWMAYFIIPFLMYYQHYSFWNCSGNIILIWFEPWTDLHETLYNTHAIWDTFNTLSTNTSVEYWQDNSREVHDMEAISLVLSGNSFRVYNTNYNPLMGHFYAEWESLSYKYIKGKKLFPSPIKGCL